MTTSNTFGFNPTVAQMITGAYQDLNVIGDDEAPTAAQFNVALYKMNSIVKSLQATGIHVWTEEEAILFLQPIQSRYQLGGASGNAFCCDAASWILGKLAQSYSSGATSIALQTTAGMSVGDNFGIVLATGATFWATVSALPGSNVVTIPGPGLPSAASSGSYTFDFPPSAQIGRPLKVPKTRLLTFASLQETPMTGPISRQEYMDLPNKQSTGTPTQVFYTPQLGVGYIYVWPVITNSFCAIRFTWYRSLADLLTPANTFDFPQEWATPLRWFLADDLRAGHNVPLQRQKLIQEKAMEWGQIIEGWDRESEPIQFGMDWMLR